MPASSRKEPTPSIRGRTLDHLISTSVDDCRITLRNYVAHAIVGTPDFDQLRADLVATRDVLNARAGQRSRHAAFRSAVLQLDRRARKEGSR